MRRKVRTLWRLLAIPILGYVGLSAGTHWQNHSTTLCHITFVPFGDFSETALRDLTQEYQRTFGVRIDLLPPLSIPEAVIDYSRGQIVGERLLHLMKQQLPQQADDPSVMMMGFTRGDMYIEKMDWQFAFALRESGRFTMISTARMDPESFGFAPDEQVLRTRLAKMVTKQIGLYFYGLPERQEKTSVLFSPILGVDDLDEVSAELDGIDRQRLAKVVKSCQQ